MSGIGQKYQQETKYSRKDLHGRSRLRHRRAEAFKEYEAPLAVIPLPDPELAPQADLWTLLRHRRSRRNYNRDTVLPLDVLSALLWATQGISAAKGDFFFRTAPSAGALYPVESYLSVRAVNTLQPGLYHFRPQHFDLELLKKGDYSVALTAAALAQNMVQQAQVTFLWSAIVARSLWKYEERAYRYIYLDAGHIAQNLYLAGEALGLGVCAIGALFDDEVNGLLDLDGTDETIVYMATVGERTR